MGEQLESMILTTALAAMALQHVPAATKAVDRALQLLEREAKMHPSALADNVLQIHEVVEFRLFFG